MDMSYRAIASEWTKGPLIQLYVLRVLTIVKSLRTVTAGSITRTHVLSDVYTQIQFAIDTRRCTNKDTV